VSLDPVLSIGFCGDPTVVPQLDLVVEGSLRELATLQGVVQDAAR
jgi:hypothetical protein